MAQASALIPYATVIPVTFRFTVLPSVNAQVRFFDAGGGAFGQIGTATLVARNYSQIVTSPGVVPRWSEILLSDITNGTNVNANGGQWYELDLGSGMSQVTIESTSTGPAPPGVVYYRLIVDADPPSEVEAI